MTSHNNIKTNITILFFILIIGTMTVAQLSFKSGNCPLRESVTKCTPSCVSDFQCSFNEKCCPNNCGHTSCVQPSAVNTGSNGGYKGSYANNAVYCNGVRCRPYEKCQFDRVTKRDKCVNK